MGRKLPRRVERAKAKATKANNDKGSTKSTSKVGASEDDKVVIASSEGCLTDRNGKVISEAEWDAMLLRGDFEKPVKAPANRSRVGTNATAAINFKSRNLTKGPTAKDRNRFKALDRVVTDNNYERQFDRDMQEAFYGQVKPVVKKRKRSSVTATANDSK